MDAIVSASLSEVCSQGIDGVSVKKLWPRLESSLSSSGLHLCDGVKTSIWTRLLNTPGLQFRSQNSSSSFTPQDTKIQSFEDAEKLNLIIIADKHLRHCFVGLYNGDTGISLRKKRVLQRLSKARTDGVTQCQLAKELHVKGTEIFYVLKGLQSQGLIVRQPTIVWTKKSGAEGEIRSKNTSVVTTNLIHLPRYANQLSSQQRLEITKFDTLENFENASEGILMNDGHGGGVKDDVRVKDYVPAMKAICDELEEADDKVRVVSDIKKALGYQGTNGHRAWRNIVERLEDAGLVELFHAEVNKKSHRCLRLLKSFYPEYGQPNFDTEQPVKFKEGDQTRDQLLELPIENQIYDLIDAEGPKGISVTEVCERLGLNKKINRDRLVNMFSRFGMPIQAEGHNKSSRYRVWTSVNFINGSPNDVPAKPGIMPFVGSASDTGLTKKIDESIEQLVSSTSKDEFKPCKKVECGKKGLEHHCSSPGDNGSSQFIICQSNSHGKRLDIKGTGSNEHHDLGRIIAGSACPPQEVATPTTFPAKRRFSSTYPCLTWTAESSQREQMILKRLQAVHVSNAKHQSRHNRCRDDLNHHNDSLSPTRKRKPSLTEGPSKRKKPEGECVFIADPVDLDSSLQSCDEGEQAKAAEESRPLEEDGENRYSFLRLKQSCQPRFQWTDASDKQLIIQYVRHRASFGTRFPRTGWVSVPDLPAPPDACKRRMHLLKKNPIFTEAVMRLCNLLGEKYAQHMAKSQEKELLTCKMSKNRVQESPPAIGHVFNSCGDSLPSDLKEQQWDDFEDQNIKMALDEVLQCRQIAKLQQDSQEELKLTPSTTTCKVTNNHDERRQRGSSFRRLSGMFSEHLTKRVIVTRLAYESLAVANAVELLKLVLLSTSSSADVPNLLAMTLLQYSEHDLFAAFSYLREKKYMVGGNGSQPFALSQQFLHNVSSSPFPTNTGRRAAKFINWLKERERDLMEDEIHLDDDLQCGDIFHLLALVSSGSLSISPSLPEEGIGEAEANMNLKRKIDNEESCSTNIFKRMKYTDNGEVVSRRAKGFPGIKVSVTRIMISKSDALELVLNGNIQGNLSIVDTNDKIRSSDLGMVNISPSNKCGHNLSLEMTVDKSPWKAMARYGDQLFSTFLGEEQRPIYPELFESAHSTIYKAGDQGVSLEQISQAVALQGMQCSSDRLAELVVHVLQVFGMTIKVNAFNDICIVDASFRSKYLLIAVEGYYQGHKLVPYMKPLRRSGQNCSSRPEDYHKATETATIHAVAHKVTLLNLQDDVPRGSSELQTCEKDVRIEEFVQVNGVGLEGVRERVTSDCTTSEDSHTYRPILPWINGDGTMNLIVYKGLVRRALGIVMQNPGLLEVDVIDQMDVLNPQSCRKLLELMILDNHLIVRKVHQTRYNGPPSILASVFPESLRISNSMCQKHFFANPMSTLLL